MAAVSAQQAASTDGGPRTGADTRTPEREPLTTLRGTALPQMPCNGITERQTEKTSSDAF